MTVVPHGVSLLRLPFLFVPPSVRQPVPGRISVKTRLREAIFRYMFSTHRYGGEVKTYCIQPDLPQS
jgi:hypothetical protein